MTDKSQPTGVLGFTGLLRHQAAIGQSIEHWRRLVVALAVEAPVAARVEDRLWEITEPENDDCPSVEEQALSIFAEVLGPGVPDVAICAHQMAERLIESGDLKAAARLLASASRIYREALATADGDFDHLNTCSVQEAINAADTWRALAQRLFRAGKFAEAKGPLEVAFKDYQPLGNARLENLAETAFDLAVTCTKLDGIDGGTVDRYFELAAALFEQALEAGNQPRVNVLIAYAEYEAAKGQAQYARRTLGKALATLRKREIRDMAAEADVIRRLDELTGK